MNGGGEPERSTKLESIYSMIVWVYPIVWDSLTTYNRIGWEKILQEIWDWFKKMNLACTLYFIVEAEEWWNFQEFTASFFDHANHLSRILVPKKYKIQHVVQYTFFWILCWLYKYFFLWQKSTQNKLFWKIFFLCFRLKLFKVNLFTKTCTVRYRH